VILDMLVTSAGVTENLPMLEMLFRSIFRWRLSPRSVTGDATYGTSENSLNRVGPFSTSCYLPRTPVNKGIAHDPLIG
jgi:hypothetical protein